MSAEVTYCGNPLPLRYLLPSGSVYCDQCHTPLAGEHYTITRHRTALHFCDWHCLATYAALADTQP
jgi:hypothetical protein